MLKNKKNASLVFGMESESCRPRKMLKFLPILPKQTYKIDVAMNVIGIAVTTKINNI